MDVQQFCACVTISFVAPIFKVVAARLAKAADWLQKNSLS